MRRKATAAFGGVGGEFRRQRGGADRAEHRTERNMEYAEPGRRAFVAIVPVLRMLRALVLNVFDQMRQRAVLGKEQQSSQNDGSDCARHRFT